MAMGLSPSLRWLLGIGLAALIFTPITASWNHYRRTKISDQKLTFSVDFGEPVVQWVDETVHYQNDLEWEQLIPSGGHLVHIESDTSVEKYTVTLFHQLKCLDILRREYMDRIYRGEETQIDGGPVARHCLNYLRQSMLCRLDLGLESTREPSGLETRGYDLGCKDWTRLYEEAERNHGDYNQSLRKNGP